MMILCSSLYCLLLLVFFNRGIVTSLYPRRCYNNHYYKFNNKNYNLVWNNDNRNRILLSKLQNNNNKVVSLSSSRTIFGIDYGNTVSDWRAQQTTTTAFLTYKLRRPNLLLSILRGGGDDGDDDDDTSNNSDSNPSSNHDVDDLRTLSTPIVIVDNDVDDVTTKVEIAALPINDNDENLSEFDKDLLSLTTVRNINENIMKDDVNDNNNINDQGEILSIKQDASAKDDVKNKDDNDTVDDSDADDNEVTTLEKEIKLDSVLASHDNEDRNVLQDDEIVDTNNIIKTETNDVVVEDDSDDDKERYSRQVYALGVRAHGRIRSSTIFLDGPSNSGLLYECAKNLALSGIKNILIVTSSSINNTSTATAGNDNNKTLSSNDHILLDTLYERYGGKLDDLGKMYVRGARSESVESMNDPKTYHNSTDDELLLHYLQRLNPNIMVSLMDRSKLFEAIATKSNDDSHYHNDKVASLLSSSAGSSDDNPVLYLCIDRPYSTQVTINEWIRSIDDTKTEWKFISVETFGIFGRIFCDFGVNFEVHDSDGEVPFNVPFDKLVVVVPQNESKYTDNKIDVYCVDGEKHDVSKNDIIQFQYRRTGEMSIQRCIVTDVYTPFRIGVMLLPDNDNDSEAKYSSIDNVANFVSSMNENASSFQKIKIPQYLSFESLLSAMEKIKTANAPDLFATCDLEKSFDEIRKNTCMACFQTLPLFVQKYKRLPLISDVEIFQDLIQEGWHHGTDGDYNVENDESISTSILDNFVRTCAAKFMPIQAMFGALAAQEALKAVTGLYYPVKQFLLYDCDEILKKKQRKQSQSSHDQGLRDTEEEPDIQKAKGLRYILGDKVVRRLQKKKLFVVGAGAIGCEILKNLAAMGAGTGNKGQIIVTDMDSIEKSNLSRQLLFRDSDIGKFKSSAARDACLRLEPEMDIEVHSTKVGNVEITPFDDKFWAKGVDIVLNALDNVEARMNMDSKCVENSKALIDAGTMGPKGNVQVIVPNESESYASSVDPPEPSIPTCTIKDFPYAISHAIHWGRTLFEKLYERRPEQTNDFMNSLSSSSDRESLAIKYLQDMSEGMAIELAKEIKEDLDFLVSHRDGDLQSVRDAALKWALELSFDLFYKAPVDLLRRHPLQSVDDEGEKFWSGTRRPPKALLYSSEASESHVEQIATNDNLIKFVANAARLRVEMLLGDRYGKGTTVFSVDEIERNFMAFDPNPYDEETEREVSALSLFGELVQSHSPRGDRLASVEFEKDDESNGHVAFVSAASNLRAISYSIPPVDEMETRRVAGRIVPAMITTTALVSALSCLELLKMVQKADMSSHRNAFVNLGLPFFAFTMPMEAEKIPGLRGKHYSLWDRLQIREKHRHADAGGITLKSILRRIRSLASDDPTDISVSSVSCGPYLLYADFLNENDDALLNASVWGLIKDAITSSSSFDNQFSRGNDDSQIYVVSDTYADLIAVVSDNETGEEIELPPIRIERFHSKAE